MNKKFQQRIVGAIAVLALLILVLPHLFSSNEYKIPEAPRTSAQSSNANNSNSEFQTPVISVEPIPTTDVTTNDNSPINESMWENVTDGKSTTNTHASIAEQLLAEVNQQTPTKSTDIDQLPKIELIGSTSANSNTQSKQTAEPKFTWYVQLGSYSSKDNANKVMLEYKKLGYSSEVAHLSGQYKVRIGPLKTQDNAKNVQAELKRQKGVNSYIIQIQ